MHIKEKQIHGYGTLDEISIHILPRFIDKFSHKWYCYEEEIREVTN